MTKTSIVRFLGDQVRRLQLTPPMLVELQRTTGMGILALYGSVIGRTARHHDLTEIVRTALIGGGTDPEEALALVKAYAEPAPILWTLRLVLEILDAVMSGAEPEPEAPEPKQAHFFEVDDPALAESIAKRASADIASKVRNELAEANAVLRQAAGIDRRTSGPHHLDLDEVQG